MKNFGLKTGIIFAFIIVFSSCTKEEDLLNSNSQTDQATVSFNALFNNLISKQQTKQATEIPECSSGTPAFVDVILTRNNNAVVGSANQPERIALNPNATDIDNDGTIDYFTEESSSLELEPGTYFLEYFTVLDENNNIIWIAPSDDGAPGGLDDMVENSLPLEIDLGAGVKKYVDVSVVCFDDRIVNTYGYLFFELEEVEIIEFCVFGNFCDETGRHAEVMNYQVDVWEYSGNPASPKGDLLHEDLQNMVYIEDHEDFSVTGTEPVCFTLPDGPGLDEYYIEITHLVGPDGELIRSGVFTDVDVRNLFTGEDAMEYYHFREGNCNLEDSPNLLNDPGVVMDTTWEFTFYFGDALLAVDVVFYPDGSASYQPYGDPSNTTWGTWALLDNYLFYDPDGSGNELGYEVEGAYANGEMSGIFWYDGFQDIWTAFKK